jgi:hypothetical protein
VAGVVVVVVAMAIRLSESVLTAPKSLLSFLLAIFLPVGMAMAVVAISERWEREIFRVWVFPVWGRRV